MSFYAALVLIAVPESLLQELEVALGQVLDDPVGDMDEILEGKG